MEIKQRRVLQCRVEREVENHVGDIKVFSKCLFLSRPSMGESSRNDESETMPIQQKT
jgi:hypothetical protein